ncbi:unnamed protein product [Strongylus vulgaris]|uniref:Uncharacterized protein n=1 Tax=Strongylus vulgaris TaxID=40348 RepID=A0A3P7L049_STRVU|nr:unnamed protein product [Strongylus vulgaris]
MDTPEEDDNSCRFTASRLHLLERMFGYCEINWKLVSDAGIQFNIPGGRTATAEYIVELMGAEYGISSAIAKEAFSLWMISGLLG